MKHEFPMKIRFGEPPYTKWFNSKDNIKLAMLDYPVGGFRSRCVEMMKATWSDKPFKTSELGDKSPEVQKEFFKILSMQVLPNSLESLNFTFRVEGLTLIEVTHLLRHRMLKSIHAQCSADRFLQKDSCFIPSSIENSEFKDEYMELTNQCKELYCKMLDSNQISILDARYILTRNHRYFYYFNIDLKTAMQFIHQRKCTQIQPEMDNIIAHKMFYRIEEVIPEISKVVSLKCDARCVYIKSDPEYSSRVYYPDANHLKQMKTLYPPPNDRYSDDYYLHKSRSRKDMGIRFNPQDTRIH